MRSITHPTSVADGGVNDDGKLWRIFAAFKSHDHNDFSGCRVILEIGDDGNPTKLTVERPLGKPQP